MAQIIATIVVILPTFYETALILLILKSVFVVIRLILIFISLHYLADIVHKVTKQVILVATNASCNDILAIEYFQEWRNADPTEK